MAEEAIKAGAKAGLSVLESSLLGAFAVLCLAIAVAAVWLLYKTQNARVADQKALADKMEGLIEKQTTFNNKTSAAIDQLGAAHQQQGAVLQTISAGVNTLILLRGGGK